MQENIPTLHIVADSIPIAHSRAMKAVWENGFEIRAEYDRKDANRNYIDPTTKDAKVLIEITNPFNQPRYSFVSYCEIGKYIAEILGAKDHLVVPYNELKEGIRKGVIDSRWPYTYHQRFFAYPLQDGSSVNQIDLILDKLAKDSISRRAVADTALPEIDTYLKEDIPCLREIHLRCTENNDETYLHMDTKWRSRDLFKAWSDNVIGLTFLQARLAEQLGKKMNKEVKVGSYTDYSSSLHIYGQDVTEKGVLEFLKLDEPSVIKKSWHSEKAKELIIDQLDDLLQEDYWNFPDSSKELISNLISDLKENKYLP